MLKKIGLIFLFVFAYTNATEFLHPINAPSTNITVQGAIELDEDIYSGDMDYSLEVSPFKNFSIYVDGAFRFLSYSYEYSMKGYVHNYCNLHVNGFNETYVGAKFMVLPYLGINANWRFPPGEGSQKNRFHRLNLEPFTLLNVSQRLVVGTSFRYNKFLDDSNFSPGDEIGLKVSLSLKLFWNETLHRGFKISEVFLYQTRIDNSYNKNLAKPYQNMDDEYSGVKLKFDIARYTTFFNVPVGFGINYEIHNGTLFGFETGHRIAFYICVVSAKYL